MKRVLILSLLICTLSGTGWAQKKIIPATKDLGRPAQRTPKQILEATRLFIGQNGHRPRTTLVSLQPLTPQQLNEIQLGGAVSRILYQASVNPALNTPTVQKLRGLVEQFPNRQKAKNASQLLTELRAFIKQNGRSPKAIFTQNGVRLKLDQLTQQEQEELRLRNAIYALFIKVNKNPALNTPEVDQIRHLLSQHSTNLSVNQTVSLQRLPQLIEQTQAFIAQYQRRPRNTIYENGMRLALYQQTPQQQEETQLGQAIQNTFTYAKKHSLTEQPEIQKLRELVKPYTKAKYTKPALTAAQILEQTQQFIALRGRRPKNAFFDEQNHYIPITQLAPEQAQEVQLAQTISHAFTKAKAGNFQGTEIQTIQDLRDLVAAYPNERTPVEKDETTRWKEVVNDLEQFIQTHHRRPRSHIDLDGITLNNEELSAAQLAEVQLGRKVSKMLIQAKQNGLENSPQFIKLQELASQYPNKNYVDISQLALKLEQFIQTYHHRPHTNFYKKLKLTMQEQQESRLGSQCYNLIRRASQNSDMLQDPALQKIIQLWENTPLQ